ncbi:MAG TPA: PqqD family protein [Blastocatellia bacterium]|nr:PqqD family protein [Blastocatellia bacterium]
MKRISKNPQVISDEADGTRMLCHTGFVEFFRLNTTGAQIWEICDGNTIDNVVESLSEAYPTEDHQYLKEEVQRFIGALEGAGLVEIQEERSTGTAS